MALDSEVEKAIKAVVNKASQPEKVANRLIAWLEDMSVKDLSPEEHSRYLRLALEAIQKNP